MNKHVVIIIPVFNQVHFTQQVLQHILPNHNSYANCSFEVLVVDDASTDNTPKFLSWFQKNICPIKWIRNQSNLGFAKSCNKGMNSVKDHCDHIILLNNDTIPKPGWIYSMVQVAESDEKIAVVGAKILKPNSDTVYHTGVTAENNVHVDRYVFKNKHQIPKHIIEPRLWVNGCCMLIKSEVIRNFGVFDETFSPCYFEEADYCVRLIKAGYKVVYNPMAEIGHYQKQTCGLIPGMSEHFYRNWEKFWSRHKEYIQNPESHMNPLPRINIIMPAYNSESYIKNTLAAIQNQTYPNYKLIVVDDASTDNTGKIVLTYADSFIKTNSNRKIALNPGNIERDNGIRYIKCPKNAGVSMARNRGLQFLENDCELVAFCDSDDLWKPHHLEELVNQLIKINQSATKDNQYQMIYSKPDLIDLKGNKMASFGINNPINFDKSLLETNNFIYISGVLLTIDAVKNIGGFDPRLTGIEDWDYWIRISKKYKIYQYPLRTFAYVIRGTGSMASANNSEKLEILRKKISGDDISNVIFDKQLDENPINNKKGVINAEKKETDNRAKSTNGQAEKSNRAKRTKSTVGRPKGSKNKNKEKKS